MAPHLGPVHPDQRHEDDAVHQHEATGADTSDVHQSTEHDRQQEPAQAASQPDDAGNHADVVWIIVSDVLEHRGFADGPRDTHGEHEYCEQCGSQPDMESLWAGQGVNGEVSLRVGQNEQNDP